MRGSPSAAYPLSSPRTAHASPNARYVASRFGAAAQTNAGRRNARREQSSRRRCAPQPHTARAQTLDARNTFWGRGPKTEGGPPRSGAGAALPTTRGEPKRWMRETPFWGRGPKTEGGPPQSGAGAELPTTRGEPKRPTRRTHVLGPGPQNRGWAPAERGGSRAPDEPRTLTGPGSKSGPCAPPIAHATTTSLWRAGAAKSHAAGPGTVP